MHTGVPEESSGAHLNVEGHMEVTNLKAAKELARAWFSYPSLERQIWVFRRVAQSQRACVGLCGDRHPAKAKGHEAAARYFEALVKRKERELARRDGV